MFDESLITPNDAFFVRYHLADIPLEIDPATFRLEIAGTVKTPLKLSLDELKRMGAHRTRRRQSMLRQRPAACSSRAWQAGRRATA